MTTSGTRQRRPPRIVGPHHDTFWEYCAQGEFRLQHCPHCDSYEWPPAPACSDCLREELEWTQVSGRGRIFSHVVFERPYYAECPAPWPVILVALEEGPWFFSDPRDIPIDELKMDLPVRVAFLDCEDTHGPFRLPVFEKA